MNSACTFGSWHPLAAEKLMALDMNVADDMSVFQFGILRIRRPDKLLCGFNFFGYWCESDSESNLKSEPRFHWTINVHLFKRFSHVQLTFQVAYKLQRGCNLVVFAINKLVFAYTLCL